MGVHICFINSSLEENQITITNHEFTCCMFIPKSNEIEEASSHDEI